MKKLLALAIAISALTLQASNILAGDEPVVILDEDGNRPTVSSYDAETKIVHIPLVNFKDVPAFSDVLLKLRGDGLFEFVDIRDYDVKTDLVESK